VSSIVNTLWKKLAQGDIDELWNRFADKISSTYKDNILVSKSMTKKFNTPWMNEVTLNSTCAMHMPEPSKTFEYVFQHCRKLLGYLLSS
jgi:hypothetical protein